jgi:hypothetical protein
MKNYYEKLEILYLLFSPYLATYDSGLRGIPLPNPKSSKESLESSQKIDKGKRLGIVTFY